MKEAAFSLIPTAYAEDSLKMPVLPTVPISLSVSSATPKILHGEESYKTIRLREMAADWKGTPLESRTVPLLAMLLTENGALAEQVRGDHGWAIGLDQTNTCTRGFLGKHYCGRDTDGWLDRQTAGTEWKGYATDWRVQFRFYTVTVLGMTNAGYSAAEIIHSWNSGEAGRLAKVQSHEVFVRAALATI